jgi:hypothetical protein
MEIRHGHIGDSSRGLVPVNDVNVGGEALRRVDAGSEPLGILNAPAAVKQEKAEDG